MFDDWDVVQWGLFLAVLAAFLGYYFWPEPMGKADAEVHVDDNTRKKANAMIALAADAPAGELFTLVEPPLHIQANAAASESNLPSAELREALWVKQRAMITRLEGELDYAQQADISEHFAIAAPANQPASLLQKTVKDLEGMVEQIRKHLRLEKQDELWHGRALILMLSNRKIFDHVAWLTGAGLAASAPGAFTLSQDRVVLIAIYATRLGGFARPLTLQVARACICGAGGNKTPKWLEYGLALWLVERMLGKETLPKGEEEPKWDGENGPAIFDAKAWTKASEDSTRLEQLVTWSLLYLKQLPDAKREAVITALPKSATEGASALEQALA